MFIVWALAGLWITGALIHQSYKEKEFNKSWRVSGSRYFSLLGVAVVTGLIAIAVGIVPYVGWIFSIIVGLAFFFAMQGVIIKGDGFVKALKESWNIFKRQPFKVFLMWLVISGITLLIVLIFALPAIALLFSIFADIVGGGTVTAGTFMSIAFAIENELVILVLAGIIFILGLGIARVFSMKAQTEFYEQIKKKHTGK
jgi:membrane-anchored glycerophosphoryl diester phosphodiesterase (GDPDase)